MKGILNWDDFAQEREAFHVASYTLDHSFQPGLHSHDFAEIFWVDEGKGLHIGEIGQMEINTGTLCIVHPEAVHRFGSNDSMTLLNVAFPATIYTAMTTIYDSVQLIHTRDLPLCYTINENGIAELNRALNELISSPKESIYLWRFIARCMCVLFGNHDQLPLDAPEWLRHACKMIRQPVYAKEGVGAFVELAGRSPEHVSRFTRKWTGMSPREIVQQARLKLAARELALTDKQIIEISLDAGFNSLGHFYKLFSSTYGIPPAEYRRSQKRLPSGIAR